jgi:hypothetical protein
MKTFSIVGGEVELNTGNNNTEQGALLHVQGNEFNAFILLTATKYLNNTKELHYCLSMATFISQLVP